MTQRAYADSSALVKLVLSEPESAALSRFLKGRGRTLTSRIATVEVSRAVTRSAGKSQSPQQTAVLASLWETVDIAELDPRICVAAAGLEPVGLRSLDAIHLASALAIGDELDIFITYDMRLADAARAHGLTVLAPG